MFARALKKNYFCAMDMITILGPTASGKTALAAKLAAELDAEIISADSRQIYSCMDIGTGKDLADYVVDGKQIPYHLLTVSFVQVSFTVLIKIHLVLFA